MHGLASLPVVLSAAIVVVVMALRSTGTHAFVMGRNAVKTLSSSSSSSTARSAKAAGVCPEIVLVPSAPDNEIALVALG